jgi:hypothetical protein
MRWHWEDGTDKINLTAMGYQGDWTATDQVPQRAIDAGIIDRFGFIDPTNGGNSRRYSLSFDWTHEEGRTTTRTSAYAGYYDLDLFSNFTYFDSFAAPVGDQFAALLGTFSLRPSGYLVLALQAVLIAAITALSVIAAWRMGAERDTQSR